MIITWGNMKNNKGIGLVVGILIATLILVIPLNNLSREGHVGLALTLMTVCFWAFQVTQTGFFLWSVSCTPRHPQSR